LTSHSAAEGVPPIRREIIVDADPDTAFEAFTARIGRWWPLGEFSVHGPGSLVEFAGEKLIERSAGGEVAIWGTVTTWSPPGTLAFTWHPGQEAGQASHVRVTFTAIGSQTRVQLEHSGWEVFDEPAAARAEYDKGWPQVLERFADDLAATPAMQEAPAGSPGETWVALVHQPGPDAPSEGGIFADPRFAWHVEFLNRMHAAGFLVAAGPLADEPGAGMTVLRLPGAGQAARARELATQDDQSVVAGLLTVTVRPWQVLLHS
jgi:uncharacterized protein YciI